MSKEQLTVTLKGNIFDKKGIWLYTLFSLLIMLPFGYFFYAKGYDLLFQLFGFLITGPVSIVLIVLLFAIVYYAAISLFNLLLKPVVTLSLVNKSLEIKSRNQFYSIPLDSIHIVKAVIRNKRWDRLSIITEKTIHINTGNVFMGIVNKELDAFWSRLSTILEKEYQYSTHKNVGQVKNVYYEQLFVYQKGMQIETVTRPLKIKTVLFILLGFFLILAGIVYYLINRNNDDDPDNQVARNGVYLPGNGSPYLSYNNEVYFLRMGDGYFKVKEASLSSFKQLTYKNEYGSKMGIDATHVYSGNNKIPGIDHTATIYVGQNFVKDGKSVFYKTRRIPGADAASFESLPHPRINTPIFSYAKDKNNVYYQDYILPGADVYSISSITGTVEYVKDSKHAYYHQYLLQGMNGRNFTAEELDYALTYGTDGRNHVVNGIIFPAKVQDRLWGSVTPDLNQMVLLQKRASGRLHLLFSDLRSLYYFDSDKQAYIHAKAIKGLRPFVNGIFKDDKVIYFTAYQNIRSRKYGHLGEVTYIHRSKIPQQDFVKYKEDEHLIVYRQGNQFYATVIDLPNIHPIYSSLYLVENISHLERELTARNYDNVANLLKLIEGEECAIIRTKEQAFLDKETD
ncbi:MULTISPECIES: DKNYY domain-containing protein [unclassified Sphingobacterium]|uniref:DKNYY domain-containing protein n=1 Tax=unclassified Sphingobacterium TaxID=2609468 RepID=UPI0025D45F97|nr:MULTISPECIES: DKNYY domain-containing protein [unclassified Sphingobacterium]